MRRFFFFGQKFGGNLQGGRFDEFSDLCLKIEQRFNLAPQTFIARAGFGQKGRALARIALLSAL
jgi:hypothetical protein